MADSDRGVNADPRRAPRTHSHHQFPESEPALRRQAAEGDPDAAFKLGLILDDRGDTHGAVEVWRGAAAAGHPKATLNLGLALAYDLGCLDEGRDLFRTAAFELGDIRGFFELAFLLWYADDYSGAEEALSHPSAIAHPRTWLHRGLLLADQGRDEEAANAFARAAELGVEEGWTHLGWQLSRAGRLEDAKAALTRGAPHDPAACGILGQVLDDLGDAEGAEVAFSDARARAEDVSMAYRDLLSQLDGEDLRTDELARWSASEWDPRMPPPLAALLFDAARLAETETRLALGLENSDDTAAATLADLYRKTGRLEQAAQLRPGRFG